MRPTTTTGLTKSSFAPPSGPSRADLEAKPSELLGVALPLLRNAHVQREEDACADERLDPRSGSLADVRETRALPADDDRLLTVALHDDVRVDVGQIAVLPRCDVFDRH